MAKHNERCKICKEAVKSLLASVFGSVEKNYDLNLPCRPEDYKNTVIEYHLAKIHEALQRYRGFNSFVKSYKLPRVDYYIPDIGMILEFDESQHFTAPRDLSLSLYPNSNGFGYSVDKWRSLCQRLRKKDNDPPYRDEQRAWYDTLRDFVPQLTGSPKTVRLFSSEVEWCSLNPDDEKHILIFKNIIWGNGNGYE